MSESIENTKRIGKLEQSFAEMNSSIQYIKENIENFVSTHDTVIGLKVKVELLQEDKIKANEAHEKLRINVQNLWIKVAGISGVISFLVAIFSQMGTK